MNSIGRRHKPDPETFKKINDAFFRTKMSITELSRHLGRSKIDLQKELSGNVPLERGGQVLLNHLNYFKNND